MTPSARPRGRGITSPRVRQVLIVAAVAAVLLQLWGLYRPSSPPSPPWFPYADKFEHAGGFALPVAFILIVAWLGGAFGVRYLLTVMMIFGAHAVVSEIIQHTFYAARTGDPFDVLADWCGIALGVLVFVIISRRTADSGRPGRPG